MFYPVWSWFWIMSLAHEVKQAYGNWLSRYPWSWFATITLRDPLWDAGSSPPQACTGWTRMGWGKAWATWTRFTDYLGYGIFTSRDGATTVGAPGSCWWFVGLEIQERGVPHLHALLGGPAVDASWRLLAFEWAYREAGFSRLLPYDSEKGASWYLAKYVAKELSDWRAQLPLLPWSS